MRKVRKVSSVVSGKKEVVRISWTNIRVGHKWEGWEYEKQQKSLDEFLEKEEEEDEA